ncbi:DUF6538 domain-containing protein [Hydrogenophaga sp.]|uniref:DUF6538 domain-containing protein n=1 Tax=Hydrogenophaga sp. TaxID=1904254 RepID=UPI0025BF4D5C|nr:DUF6538 domain-containing protein [Hydrogenophaga sp.]
MTKPCVAKPLGLFLRAGVYQVRVMIPLALQPAYEGRSKLIRSLNTTDRKEADRLGTEARAALLAEFDDKARQLNLERTLRHFETQHPGVPLRDISRGMEYLYRTWLLETCKTPKTARDRLAGINSLLKYASRDLEWAEHHKWEDLDIKAKTSARRRSFTDDELKKLFSTGLHMRYAMGVRTKCRPWAPARTFTRRSLPLLVSAATPTQSYSLANSCSNA